MLKVKREQHILINSLIYSAWPRVNIESGNTCLGSAVLWKQWSREMQAYDVKYMFFSKIYPISSSPFQIDMGQTIWKRMLPQRAGCLKL